MTKPKAKRGRPPGKPAFETRINIKCDLADVEAWDEAAALMSREVGVQVDRSGWIRMTLNKALGR